MAIDDSQLVIDLASVIDEIEAHPNVSRSSKHNRTAFYDLLLKGETDSHGVVSAAHWQAFANKLGPGSRDQQPHVGMVLYQLLSVLNDEERDSGARADLAASRQARPTAKQLDMRRDRLRTGQLEPAPSGREFEWIFLSDVTDPSGKRIPLKGWLTTEEVLERDSAKSGRVAVYRSADIRLMDMCVALNFSQTAAASASAELQSWFLGIYRSPEAILLTWKRSRRKASDQNAAP